MFIINLITRTQTIVHEEKDIFGTVRCVSNTAKYNLKENSGLGLPNLSYSITAKY